MHEVIEFERGPIKGLLHRPDGIARGGIALTHGAGGNCNAKILLTVADAFLAAGWTVLRYNLPFRRERPFGPPMPKSAAVDQAGIRDALQGLRELAEPPIVGAGVSYGGRQTTMVAAEQPKVCDGVLALSYPLHPPGKPGQLRTAHFASLRVPILFVSGTRDEFGTVDEMNEAIQAISGRHTLAIVEGAGHDLKNGKFDVETLVVRKLEALLLPSAAERVV